MGVIHLSNISKWARWQPIALMNMFNLLTVSYLEKMLALFSHEKKQLFGE